MTIQIRAQGFSLTRSLEKYIRKRTTRLLKGQLPKVSTVQVGLSDINGPRGGDDKCCRISIALPQQRDVVVMETQSDMYNAIDSALRRARGSLRRRLSKLRARKRDRSHIGHWASADAPITGATG